MKALICPNCSREFVKRVSRRGLLEKCLSYFYIFPFRCQLCSHRFKRLQWGNVYRKVVYDRRDLERVPAHLNVSISTESGKHCTGALKDLSLRGCKLTTDAAFSEGSILRLELHVPSEEQPIVVVAAAIRESGIEYEHVEFLRLEHAEKERLRALVKELQASLKSESKDKFIAA